MAPIATGDQSARAFDAVRQVTGHRGDISG